MTLRDAERAVLEAAERWEQETPAELEGVNLREAVKKLREVRAAGKPKAKCYCGRTVSIEGDSLRYHRRGDRSLDGHAPLVEDVLLRGGKLLCTSHRSTPGPWLVEGTR